MTNCGERDGENGEVSQTIEGISDCLHHSYGGGTGGGWGEGR